MKLFINYGVEKKNKKKKFISKNGKIEMLGDWTDKEIHKKIRTKIKEDNPTWSIQGYALAKEENE